MISGDAPILSLTGKGRVEVHPSPWNGKEHLGNPVKAPLGGIICLEQGPTNRIQRFPVRDAVPFVLRQCIVIPENEDQINNLFGILDAVFEQYPVWKFENLGDPESTQLLRDTILSHLQSQEEG